MTTSLDIPTTEPKRFWWARPRKLCLLERPGGGGRSHRPERREGEIAWLRAHRVRMVVSTMATRHGLAHYEAAGLAWHHIPVTGAEGGEEVLDDLISLLCVEARRAGAVAVHGNRHTDFVAAVGAGYLRDTRGVDPVESLAAARAAGLMVTPEACRLLDVELEMLP